MTVSPPHLRLDRARNQPVIGLTLINPYKPSPLPPRLSTTYSPTTTISSVLSLFSAEAGPTQRGGAVRSRGLKSLGCGSRLGGRRFERIFDCLVGGSLCVLGVFLRDVVKVADCYALAPLHRFGL